MQKWTQGVDAMHHGVEVSRLDAMDHGAEVLDAGNAHSDVAVAKKKVGATDPGAEVLTQNTATPPRRCAPPRCPRRLPPALPPPVPRPRPRRCPGRAPRLPPAGPAAVTGRLHDCPGPGAALVR